MTKPANAMVLSMKDWDMVAEFVCWVIALAAWIVEMHRE